MQTETSIPMKTERLLLRRFRPDDWRDLYEYLSDAEVVRFEPYAPLTERQCQEATVSHSESREFWTVCLKEAGKLIGNLYVSEREQHTREIGFVFNRFYQRRGYATEAAVALIDNMFKHENTHRVTANCNPENTASWRLLERLGMRREGHLKQNIYFKLDANGTPLWQDTFVYGILESEWPNV